MPCGVVPGAGFGNIGKGFAGIRIDDGSVICRKPIGALFIRLILIDVGDGVEVEEDLNAQVPHIGLTWDCVDISEESIRAGKASVFVNKELQRVNKKIMKTLDSKDVIRVFPEAGPWNKTVLVLKTPKTLTSVRKVFLPKTVAEML